MSHSKDSQTEFLPGVKITFEPYDETDIQTPKQPGATKKKRARVITMVKTQIENAKSLKKATAARDTRKPAAKSSKSTPKEPKPGKGKPSINPAGIRTAQILGLLKKGATLQDMMSATGWQAHSVRGFLSGVVGKKLGLRLRSEKRDGTRVYSL